MDGAKCGGSLIWAILLREAEVAIVGGPSSSEFSLTDYNEKTKPDFFIDGMLSGTGLRDATRGGYVEPTAAGMSASLASEITLWQQRYENAHFDGFPAELVTVLDNQGIALAARAAGELPDKSIGYFSNGLMKRLV